MSDEASRRPLLSRGTTWARGMASGLARAGVSPNAISLAGLVLALAGAAAFFARGWLEVGPGQAALLILAGAAGNQLRLLCNLMDGLVAVEHGAGGATGDLWNELPDRISDAVVSVAVGHAATSLAGSVTLGWCAAALALLCAYVRALGASAGVGQVFAGPLSKPWRGALLTVASILAAALAHRELDEQVLRATLVLLVLGTALTCLRRTLMVARRLKDAA